MSDPTTHAIAHLDLHCDPMPEWFTEQHCEDADFYATIRLDREPDRDWLESD